MSDERRQRILARARAVPVGFVTTYGDLCPEAPRLAGRVLATHEGDDVPWQRVVHADGSLAVGARQRRLLEDEGVPFDGGRVSMDVARVPAEALDDLTEGER
jgi:alkylated DNA nucleotide flippase Atl1